MKEKDLSKKYEDTFNTKYEIIEKDFHMIFDGKPENYVRERFTSRGNRFYNKKGPLMTEMKKKAKDMLSKDDSDFMKSLLSSKENIYYLSFDVTYYVKIAKNESKINTYLKENNFILPAITPDVDNYDKFLCDSLHDVFYDDDKRLIEIHSKKLYSTNPRTDLKVHLKYLRKKD